MKPQTITGNGNWKSFTSLSGERLVFVVKEHWFVLVINIVPIVFLTILFFFLLTMVFTRLYPSGALLFVSLATNFVIMTLLTVHAIISWYYHVYILTTRRLFEVSFSPLLAVVDNEVLLEQVKATEVDVVVEGIFNQLLDLGDIVVTFDRPTHQQEFILKNIPSPRNIAMALNNSLLETHGMKEKMNGKVWYPDESGKSKFAFTEEIFRSPV